MIDTHSNSENRTNRSNTWFEGEQAIAELTRPNESEPFGIDSINLWLQTHSKLFEVAQNGWQKYSCFGSQPCSCSDASSEYRLYQLYKLLVEISALHDKEVFFKKQLKVLEAIEKNEEEVKVWLSANQELLIHGFDCLGLDFWDECDKYKHVAFQATMLGKPDTEIYLKREDFVCGVQLLERFKKIYINSL